MTATVGDRRTLKRHRIIERPRLLGLLDESNARVRTLVAPAGYGKTTLAEQWIGKPDRRGAWFTARRASVDVAGLALGVARAASTIVEGCDERLREHLRAVPASSERVDVLAELLGEDLAGWPPDSWLVIDEYQELSRAPEAEQFVAELVAAPPVQALIASRQRPSWVTTRGILYGEILELNQTALAMDAHEAAQALAGRSSSSASGLVALANGWPAVIGLAGVSTAEIDGEDEVPESLYRFFAEEVLSALGEGVAAALETLAIAPVLDRRLAATLLRDDVADTVCRAALDVGILVERGQYLALHPLARSFLDDRRESAGQRPDPELVDRCIAHYRASRDWDAAFDVISRHGRPGALEELVADALDDLLETARLATIEAWAASATGSELGQPIFGVARAEAALRRGRHAEAQVLAESASARDSELAFRALSVAGRAAHLASREHEALELYTRAETAASTEDEHREARWGRVRSLIDLESQDAVTTLAELVSESSRSDPREVVRTAGGQVHCGLRFGLVELAEADRAVQLLDATDDPLVTSAFLSVYSTALGLSARYAEALDASRALLNIARTYRLDFAEPYARRSAGAALAGLRMWAAAEEHLKKGIAAARRAHDAYAEQVCYGVLVRTLAQYGRHQAALLLEFPDLTNALSAARVEVHYSRALVLASLGRANESLEVVEEHGGVTQTVEPLVLGHAVEAIAALKQGDRTAIELISRLEEAAFATGAVDLLVTAYRSCPDLLAVLLGQPQSERIVGLVRRVRDDDLASMLGQPVSAVADPRQRLTKREREVYGFMCRGLSNGQIADLLVLSEETVKLHAHHVYAKLGTNSRTALAVQAALERADQATSAIDTVVAEDDSS